MLLVGSSSISTILEYEIAGSNGLTARNVIDRLQTNLNCKTLIFGGCVRDIVRGVDLDNINDIDFEIFCSSNEVFEHCEEHWGQSLCKLGRNMHWVTIGDGNSRMAEQTTMDAVPLTIIFNGFFQLPAYLEFTTNSLFYDHNDDAILDVSGTGMEDTCDCHVRIPVGADEEQWNNYNITFGYGLKRYRYFKLLVKGYTALEETQNFIVMKVKAEIATDELPFYLCHYVVMGYFDNDAHECIDVEQALCESNLVPYEEQLRDQLGVEFYGSHVVSKLEDTIPDCHNSTVPADKGVSIHSFPLPLMLIAMMAILALV